MERVKNMGIFVVWVEKIYGFLPQFLVDLIQRMIRHRIMSVGAEIAYFLLLSIFPLLICGMTLIGFFPLQANAVLLEFQPYMPHEVFTLIESLMNEISGRKVTGILSFGLIIGLWFASKGIHAMVRAFNISYEVEEGRSYIKDRLIAIVLTVTFILVVVLSLLLPIFGKHIIRFLADPFEIANLLLIITNQLRYVMAGIILFFTFVILFYFGPHVKLRIRDAVPGALLTTIGWLLVSYIFSAYVDAYANYTKIYGSLGGIILLLLWFYMTGILVLVGGELNAYIYASRNKMYQNLPKPVRYFLIKKKRK